MDVRGRDRFGAGVLMPLKRVDPFVVRVDNSTGIVDVVPVYAGRATAEEAVTRYFLTHYLTVCERFNFATAESDYEECGAFHSAQRNQAWYALWTATNPSVAAQCAQGWQHGPGAGQFGELLHPLERTVRSCQVRYLKAARQGAGAEETVHPLDGDHSIRLCGTCEGSEDAPLESARLQDRGFSLRTRSHGGATAGEGHAPCTIAGISTRREALRGSLRPLLSAALHARSCGNDAGERRRRQPDPSRGLQRRRGLRLRGSSAIRSISSSSPARHSPASGAGDMEGLSFVGQDNHLFLKPKAAKVATNLTVLTNRRHYQFDYTARRSVPGRDDQASSMRCDSPIRRRRHSRRPKRRPSGSILNWTDAVDQAAAEHRLLVLRRAGTCGRLPRPTTACTRG